MATPELVEIQSLLQPIAEDSPTGTDIREDFSPTSRYQTIKSERNLARAAERQSIHDGDSQEAFGHWRKIATLAPQILQEQSKDLEVACWYTEAMVRLHGFAGLRDAFLIIDGLIETFWDDLHPMPDEYGMETRVSCLSGLNGEGAEGVLIAPLRKVEITGSDNPGPFSFWQYLQALDLQKIVDEQSRRSKIADLGFSLDDIDKSVAQSDDSFFVDIRDDLAEAIELYRKIGRNLDEKCGLDDAPPTRTIVEILEECAGAVNHIAKLKFPTEVSTADDSGGEQSTGAEQSGAGSPAAVAHKGPIATREEAFRQLLEISEYFLKTEPHSPVSYVLQKAVKWGNMPLGDLIQELIPDSSSRERYSELTGVSYHDDE
jgi:type VI secretion system protein ImpA